MDKEKNMATVTIVGAGMMGSALAFPARENGHEVRLVGTPLDREIIDACRKTNRHPKFEKDFPEGVKFYQIEEMEEADREEDEFMERIRASLNSNIKEEEERSDDQ